MLCNLPNNVEKSRKILMKCNMLNEKAKKNLTEENV